MTVERLARVMQRVRARFPGEDSIPRDEFRKCIMIECGTTKATFYNNKYALVKLGWIKTSKTRIKLTGKDLTEDYI